MITVPSIEDARKIASRAVLVKAIYDVWGVGSTYEELEKDMNQKPLDRLEGVKWRLEIECFGRSYAREEQLAIMQKLKGAECLSRGTVSIKQAEKVLAVLEDAGIGRPRTLEPKKVYFGERLCTGGREIVNKFNLKTRPFLGTTTMDPELSVITANMAQATHNTLAYDPFVGTA